MRGRTQCNRSGLSPGGSGARVPQCCPARHCRHSPHVWRWRPQQRRARRAARAAAAGAGGPRGCTRENVLRVGCHRRRGAAAPVSSRMLVRLATWTPLPGSGARVAAARERRRAWGASRSVPRHVVQARARGEPPCSMLRSAATAAPLWACVLVVAGSSLGRPALAASSAPAAARLSPLPAFSPAASDAALRLRGGAPGRSLHAPLPLPRSRG